MDRWHIEPCKGNAEANMKYCMKENDFIEIGESPRQGKEMIYILQNKWFWKEADERNSIEVNSHQAMRTAELLKNMSKYKEISKHTCIGFMDRLVAENRVALRKCFQMHTGL